MSRSQTGIDLFSVGHSNRSLDELIGLLRGYGIRTLVDIRSRPSSRRHPWLGRAALEQAMADAGVGYNWEGRDLGGLRRSNPDDHRHIALEEPGFRAYAGHMASERFHRAVRRLLDTGARGPAAFLCAEKDPARCHRSLLSDYLVLHGCRVTHLIEPDRARLHEPHPGVRLSGESPVYDRRGQLGLEL